jgi:hypothetical protein
MAGKLLTVLARRLASTPTSLRWFLYFRNWWNILETKTPKMNGFCHCISLKQQTVNWKYSNASENSLVLSLSLKCFSQLHCTIKTWKIKHLNYCSRVRTVCVCVFLCIYYTQTHTHRQGQRTVCVRCPCLCVCMCLCIYYTHSWTRL